MNRNDIYDSITDKITAKLESGVIPWRLSWQRNIPCNFVTKKHYNGINFLSLIAEDYSSPYYLTYLQCNERGGKILEGSKGSLIVFWKMHNFTPKSETDAGAKVPILRYSYAFNLSQTTLYTDNTDEIKLLECEEVIRNIFPTPVIKHNINRCYYSIQEDYISIPIITDFDNPAEYYSSLYHELIHWTAAASRLKRDLSPASKIEEELIAEIGSAYLCGLSGINTPVLENQSAYINGWLNQSRSDNNIFIKASLQARKAVDYLLSGLNEPNLT